MNMPPQGGAGEAVRWSQWKLNECQEKGRTCGRTEPYHKPTQVGGQESAKVYERTLAQELGNLVSVTSE